MGITRDSRHKHRPTGGRMPVHQKKRKFELGRPPAHTKLGPKRVRAVRCFGGNLKYRALRLEAGNFAWGSENCTRPTRIVDVVYNASNNELVRTKVLVKNCIVQIDATPFKAWYTKHYGVELTKKGKKAEETTTEKEKQSGHVLAKIRARQRDRKLDPLVEEQLVGGRILACVSSRPGQTGRADGYILEGKELEFYRRAMQKKKKA
uniref:40S ribosomal protein S8 n=1 Tax=Chromera velia CCMP2878 TaxID=1169474 RepID=A0A0G4G743_9ALVE|eukprot:Cvel_4261.t1-p1 / transcript=Cvel_4261.t1 / gene=Cvel_4261 / organism=Chromera_velia_CCMP2878 / gene_product=40S ribosomal protein S8, putative / transcript_product=40S ribosomal protein S8, putative / location=Cvel_scaffold184:91379-95781(-) / protein_length=205 / sequence_SO=supercontig / SO=protein_coding / is_pseudo=false